MKIRLKVQETSVRLKVKDDAVKLRTEQGIPIYPDAYAGSTTVTPSDEAQVLNTAGLMVAENIIVEPIPNNYGLITYNGSIITVS